MATSTLITDYLGRGLAANRPSSPPIGSGAMASYFSTDTGDMAVWNGTSWVSIATRQTISAGTLLGNAGTVSAVAGPVAIGTGLSLSVGGTLSSTFTHLGIPLVFSGKPGAGQMIHVPLLDAVPFTIAANFANARTYLGTHPTANQNFVVAAVNAGTITTIGTVSISTAGSITLSSSAYTKANGDVLRITAPSTPDATLADFGITLEAIRQ